MDQPYQLPDLNSVLQTLASFTAPQNQQHQGISVPVSVPPSGHVQCPPQTVPIEKIVQKPEKLLVDPATIIDWSSGLRCVMKTVAAHEDIIKEIRRVSHSLFPISVTDFGQMIKVQH